MGVNRIGTWTSYIECPKSHDTENKIRKYCMDFEIEIKYLYSKDCNRDFLDKILGIRKETVYFKLEGDPYHLQTLINHFIEIEQKY